MRELVEVHLRFQREMARLALEFASTAMTLGLETKQELVDALRGRAPAQRSRAEPPDRWARSSPPARGAERELEERPSAAGAKTATPAPSAMVLAGEAGQIVRSMFAVENTLETAVSSPLSATKAIGENGELITLPFTFVPPVIQLGPGEQVLCVVELCIDDSIPAEVSFRSLISAGMEGTQIPVIVRRTLPVRVDTVPNPPSDPPVHG